jgi:hypothetical protein
MGRLQQLGEAEGLVLDAAYSQFESATRALDQSRRDLALLFGRYGLSASSRRIDRSRQWCLTVVNAVKKLEKRGEREPFTEDLVRSVSRRGVLEPILVEQVGRDELRIVDGHRRLAAAREAGISALPVTILLSTDEDRTPNVARAETALRDGRAIRFSYRKDADQEAEERTVDLWDVARLGGRWYLIGFDRARQDRRNFRVSRVDGEIVDAGARETPIPEKLDLRSRVWTRYDRSAKDLLAVVAAVLDSMQGTESELEAAREPEVQDFERATPAALRRSGGEGREHGAGRGVDDADE